MRPNLLNTPSLPPCAAIDFTDGAEARAYAHLLTATYQHIGGFSDTGRTSALLSAIEREARSWIAAFDRQAPILPAHKLYPPLTAYDMLHRIATGRPARHGAIARWSDTVYRAWTSGNRQISETDIMELTEPSMLRDIRALPRGRALWYLDTIQRWISESTSAPPFAGIPADEAYRRLCLLLRSDLSLHVDDSRTIRHTLEIIRNSTLLTLSHSPHLNPYDRQAYSLDLRNLRDASL